jgi:hypothetical protein
VTDDIRKAQDLLAKIRADEVLNEEQFVERCLGDLMGGWIPLAQYLRMFPDESANAVYKRVQSGVWRKQVHYVAPQGSPAWVNLPAIRLWLEGRLEQGTN